MEDWSVCSFIDPQSFIKLCHVADQLNCGEKSVMIIGVLKEALEGEEYAYKKILKKLITLMMNLH